MSSIADCLFTDHFDNVKREADDSVQKHRARWAVRGFKQVERSVYAQTIAAVDRPMSYKALFAIAAAMDHEVEEIDLKTAFLYGCVEDEVRVEQPIGYVEDSDSVSLLEKLSTDSSNRLVSGTILLQGSFDRLVSKPSMLI